MAIYTHQRADLDSASAVAALLFYCRDRRNEEIIFVDANWNGPMEEEDIAIDIHAGGRGMKGRLDPDGTRHSAFEMVVSTFAPEGELKIIAPYVSFVDDHDAYGDVHLRRYGRGMSMVLRTILIELSLLFFYRAMRSTNGSGNSDIDDRKLIQVFEDLLEGYRLNRIARSMQGKSALMQGIVDLDEGLADAAYREYNKVSKSVQSVFDDDHVWMGRLSDGSVIIEDVNDLNAGCFFEQVMANAPEEEQLIFKSLVHLMEAYIVNQRSTFEYMLRDTKYAYNYAMHDDLTNMSVTAAFDSLRRAMELRGYGRRSEMNLELLSVARRIFKAFRKNRMQAAKVHTMIEKGNDRLIFLPSKQVVIKNNMDNHRINDVLFNYYGVRAVIMIDENKLIIRRADGENVRMDHPDILQVLFDAGELDQTADAAAYCKTMQNGKNGEWFLHEAGFLVANATNKAPDTQPSSVDPMVLAKAVESVLLANPIAS